MLFKKSTREIVTRNRPAGQPQAAETAENLPGAEQPVSAQKLPTWLLWAGIAGILVVVLIIVLVLMLPKEPAAPEEPTTPTTTTAPTLPVIQNGQTVVSVEADVALASLVSPGDIVQLLDAHGRPIELLRYVQVYRTDEKGYLLLLVDAEQAATIASSQMKSTVILVCHDDPKRAAELVKLQKQLADPVITLTLQEKASVAPGSSTVLEWSVSVFPEEATLPTVVWSTSDMMIASVADGTVKGWNLGEVVVTATCGHVKATCVVTVSSTPAKVNISAIEMELVIGQTQKLSASPNPYNASAGKPVWTSSDPAVASVSSDGTVTGVAAGKATITATIDGISATCVVTVGVQIESVTLEPTSLTMAVGQTIKLNATVLPEGAVGVLNWGCSNRNVLQVDQDGTVTALAPGEATVFLISPFSIADCKISVAG